jgi:hypothetical protein
MSGEKIERKQIVGSSFSGEERVYEFVLVETVTGLRIFHEYASLVIAALPNITEALQGDSGSMLSIAKLVPQMLTFQRLEMLAKDMLAGSKIGESESDENGMCDMFREDPLEFYVAIFWSIAANYPKYVDPFLAEFSGSGEGSEGEDQEDLTLDLSNGKKEKEARN